MPAAAPPSTLFQAHRAAPGKVPPPSSPLPQTRSRRGQGRLRASVPSPPKWEGVGSGMASAPTRSLPRPPRWPGAPFPLQPETHSSAPQQPQPPHRVHAHRHSPYTRAAPPHPQLPAAVGSGAVGGITSAGSRTLSTSGRLVPGEAGTR